MRKAYGIAALMIVLALFTIGLTSGIKKGNRDGGYKDLVEQLYFQAVKQNENLKSIEESIEDFQRNKDEAIEKYNNFSSYNNRYYSDAKTNAAEISDGNIRQRTLDIINKSESAYNTRLTEWKNIIATMKEKEKELRDLHVQLMILTSIPSIEKYQSSSFPDPSRTKEANADLQQVINKIKAITKG
jgi:hypothetical protein